MTKKKEKINKRKIKDWKSSDIFKSILEINNYYINEKIEKWIIENRKNVSITIKYLITKIFN